MMELCAVLQAIFETMDKLREIQLAETEILAKFDRFCENNNLEYFIIYGTLLGAVRHNGFIPWDDDADVCMRYQDVKRLKKIFKIDGLFLQTEDSEKELPLPFYKIRKNGTFFPEIPTEKLNIHQGLWIDVFPVYPAARSLFLKKIQYRLGLMLYPLRRRYINANDGRKLYVFLTKLPNAFLLAVDHTIQKLIYLLGDKTEKELYIVFDSKIERCFFDRNLFFPLCKYSFENHMLYGPKNSDAFLRKAYGDYMTPKKYDSHTPDYSAVIL